AEVAEGDIVVAAVLVGKCEPCAERDVGAHNAVSTVEIPLYGAHVHRAALALRVTAPATRQLGHDTLGIHAASQHVAMVAVGRDDLISLVGTHLQADDDRLLANVEEAEAADEAHAVKLTGLFLKSPDQ